MPAPARPTALGFAQRAGLQSLPSGRGGKDHGDLLSQGRYKRREIRKLRETFPNILIGIGNSDTDSEGYGANGILSLIVNRKGDTRYGRHEIEFEDWRQLGRFFEANRELLGDVNRLRAASRGEEMVLVPTLRFLDPADAE